MAESSQYSSSGTGSTHAMYRGEVKDWGQLERVWENISEQLNLTTIEEQSSTSILLVESARAEQQDRGQWAEMLFETFKAPSICIANGSSLALFASGRTTGLSVECGAGLTSVVPVFDGLALTHAAITISTAGQDITMNLKKLLTEKGVITDMATTQMLKEKMSFAFVPTATQRAPQTSFFLPDGTDVTIDSKLLSSCVEPLFVGPEGLGSRIRESISLCDESVKRDLASNIVISGGTTMMDGFGDRLNYDLLNLYGAGDPLSHSIQVVPSANFRERGYTSQRKHASWIGGSLLGSFDTYHESLKITRQEWDENPAVVLNTKAI